ncbi:major facilitator superfamily domain-containing protein [Mortierella sp. GBAus27b]|nr:major facilitator superfamily domain-containing protein [Mortierella sp. GBAus27b]
MGHISDRCGVLNTAIICGTAAGLSCLFIWTQAKTFTTLAIFMVLYGAFAGPSFMLLPVAATREVDPSRISSALGFSFFAHSIGLILGAPMTRRIVEAHNGNYTGAIIVVGVLDILSAALLLAARINADRRLWAIR